MLHMLVGGVLVAGWINPFKLGTESINFYPADTAKRLYKAKGKLSYEDVGKKAEETLVVPELEQKLVKLERKKNGIEMTVEDLSLKEGEVVLCSVFCEEIDTFVLKLDVLADSSDGLKLPPKDKQAVDIKTTPLLLELTPEQIKGAPHLAGMKVPKAQRPRTTSGTGGIRTSLMGKGPKEPKPEKVEGEKKKGIMDKITRGTSLAKTPAADPADGPPTEEKEEKV